MSIGTNPLGPDLPTTVDPLGVLVVLLTLTILGVVWTLLQRVGATLRSPQDASLLDVVIAGLALAYLLKWWRSGED